MSVSGPIMAVQAGRGVSLANGGSSLNAAAHFVDVEPSVACIMSVAAARLLVTRLPMRDRPQLCARVCVCVCEVHAMHYS